jgi:hypothetical protein
MLRYNVDEENVGGKEIEARSYCPGKEILV